MVNTTKIVGRIREALKGDAPVAPPIEQNLRLHEAKLTDLERERGDLALAVSLGELDAQAALDTWRDEVEAERRLVSDLHSALASARERDGAAERAARAKVNAGQVASLRQRLHARDALVLKLCEDIASAAMRWQDIIAAHVGIRGLLAELNLQGLMGVYTRDGELRAGIEHEMFRVGAGPSGRNGVGFPLRFPGAQVARLEWANDPDAVPPLHDEAVRATKYILELATGASSSRSPRPARASTLQPVEVEPASLSDDPNVSLPAGPTIDASNFVLPPVAKMRLTDD